MFSISYQDSINFSYFAGTIERGFGEWKETKRQGDFENYIISPNTRKAFCLHGKHLIITFHHFDPFFLCRSMRQLLNSIHEHRFDLHMEFKVMHEFYYLAIFGEWILFKIWIIFTHMLNSINISSSNVWYRYLMHIIPSVNLPSSISMSTHVIKFHPCI